MKSIELEVEPARRPSARCAVHDLATAPDGRCTICRREGAGASVQAGAASPYTPIAVPPSALAGARPARSFVLPSAVGITRNAFRLVVVLFAIFPLSLLLWATWEWSKLSDDERMDKGAHFFDELERRQQQKQPQLPQPRYYRREPPR